MFPVGFPALAAFRTIANAEQCALGDATNLPLTTKAGALVYGHKKGKLYTDSGESNV